jgi:hypothetical protein
VKLLFCAGVFGKTKPLLMFNSTDADDGSRFTYRTPTPWDPNRVVESVSVGRAALDSARFPLVSPPGAGPGAHRRLVDGGYFDNSGSVALREALEEGRAARAFDSPIAVVRIDGNPGAPTGECDTFLARFYKENPAFSPVESRTAKIPAKRWLAFSAVSHAREQIADRIAHELDSSQAVAAPVIHEYLDPRAGSLRNA